MNRRRQKFVLDEGLLTDKVIAELRGLPAEDFLNLSSLDMAIKRGTTVAAIKAVKDEVRMCYGIQPHPAWLLFAPLFPKLRMVSPLDLVLMNVIREQHLVEIAGESGTGKTRLTLYIIAVVLLTTDYSVALILTSIEDALGTLIEIINSLSFLLTVPQVDTSVLLKRLYFLRETMPSNLVRLFSEDGQVWELCKTCPTLKLICVDSIGLLRILYTRSGGADSQTNNPGYSIGQSLVAIARLKRLAVVVTNHVGDYISTQQLMSSAQQHAQQGQFPGQSIPGRLPQLPSNSIEAGCVCIYRPELLDIVQGGAWLVQGDNGEAGPPILAEQMTMPNTSLPLPEVQRISYMTDRTFYRDVVTSSNKLVTPSLGISWASHVSTRVCIGLAQKESILHVLWSESLPACSIVLPRIPCDLADRG